jgi:hypothetical protein
VAAHGSRDHRKAKGLLHKKTFEQTIAKTTEDDAVSLPEFRKNYNIRHAIENTPSLAANNCKQHAWNVEAHFASLCK